MIKPLLLNRQTLVIMASLFLILILGTGCTHQKSNANQLNSSKVLTSKNIAQTEDSECVRSEPMNYEKAQSADDTFSAFMNSLRLAFQKEKKILEKHIQKGIEQVYKKYNKKPVPMKNFSKDVATDKKIINARPIPSETETRFRDELHSWYALREIKEIYGSRSGDSGNEETYLKITRPLTVYADLVKDSENAGQEPMNYRKAQSADDTFRAFMNNVSFAFQEEKNIFEKHIRRGIEQVYKKYDKKPFPMRNFSNDLPTDKKVINAMPVLSETERRFRDELDSWYALREIKEINGSSSGDSGNEETYLKFTRKSFRKCGYDFTIECLHDDPETDKNYVVLELLIRKMIFMDKNTKVWFVKIGDGMQIPRAFINRFSDCNIPVKSISEAKTETYIHPEDEKKVEHIIGVTDPKTGIRGKLISVKILRWIDEKTAEVRYSSYYGPLAASGGKGEVCYVAGKWIFYGKQMWNS